MHAVLLAIVAVPLVLELVRFGPRGGGADLEDAGWFVTHWLLVPASVAVVELPHAAQLWRGVAFVLLVDASGYWLHRAMHATRLGWSVHRLHHESRELGTLATWRMSVLERLALGATVAGAAALARPALWHVAAASVLFVAIDVAAHARRAGGAWLERVGVLSGRAHHAHHWVGAQHNFGSVFTWWDRLAGTWRASAPGEVHELGLGPEGR